MSIALAEETQTQLSDVVHADTQQTARYGFDLTVDEIYRITGSGALDFGGSEFEEPTREALEPEFARPEDDYGWWELRAGTYLLRFNEGVELEEESVALVLPHERLLSTGGRHAAFQVQGAHSPLETTLVVPERGLRIKENARVSKVVVFDA